MLWEHVVLLRCSLIGSRVPGVPGNPGVLGTPGTRESATGGRGQNPNLDPHFFLHENVHFDLLYKIAKYTRP